MVLRPIGVYLSTLLEASPKQGRLVDYVDGWVEGDNMEWTWNSPVALGLFLLMAGVALVLLAVAIAVVSGKAKVSDLPTLGLWQR